MSAKIQVVISNEMNEKLKDYALRYGVSKSAIMSFICGQWVDSMERTTKAVFGEDNNYLKDIIKSAIKEGEKDNG